MIKAGLSDVLNREPETEKDDEDKKKKEDEIDINTLDATTLVPLSKQDSFFHNRKNDKKKGKGIYFKVSEGGANLSAGEK